MRSAELEQWARSVIGRGAHEDTRVECKREWISDHKAARILAGHCNAAQGEPILWIIGVDDSTGEVFGAEPMEVSNWWNQVVSRFDGPAPDLQHLVISSDDDRHLPIVLLLFDTEQAPFVITTKETGNVDREVPYRSGTRTRTAKRHELLRLLVPRQSMPQLDVTGAFAEYSVRRGPRIFASINIYAALPLGAGMVIPHHQVSARLVLPTQGIEEEIKDDVYCAAGHHSYPMAALGGLGERPMQTVHQGERQVIVDGPGFFRINLECQILKPLDPDTIGLDELLAIYATLRPAGSDVPLRVQATLRPDPTQSNQPTGPETTQFKWVVGVPL